MKKIYSSFRIPNYFFKYYSGYAIMIFGCVRHKSSNLILLSLAQKFVH